MVKECWLPILLILLIGSAVIPGCIMSPQIAEKPEIPVIPPLLSPTVTPVVTPVPVITHKPVNGSFITIDPVPDHYLGETITFTGTTNLLAGENLSLIIRTTDFHGCQKTIYPCKNPDTVNAICCMGGFTRTVTVIPGNNGINTWIFSVNTSDVDFMAGSYVVNVGSGMVYGNKIFTILEKLKPSDYWLYITSIVISDKVNIMLVQGTTNLPRGENLMVWIGQEAYHTCPKMPLNSCNNSVSACCGGIIRAAYVQQGNKGINTWSLTLNTSQHGFRQGDEYEIQVSSPDFQLVNASRIVLRA